MMCCEIFFFCAPCHNIGGDGGVCGVTALRLHTVNHFSLG